MNTEDGTDRSSGVFANGTTRATSASAASATSGATTAIDWSSVSSVETVGAKAYGALDDTKRVIVIHAQPAISVVAPDVALATRIAYAMEFLRAACDVSAETGF